MRAIPVLLLTSCFMASCIIGAFCILTPMAHAQNDIPPQNLKIAFIGDQGLGADSVAVLQLILDEGADAVIHSGDRDYDDNPFAWELQINTVLGADFPYFASIGNHDLLWYYLPGGYRDLFEDRLERIGIPWSGDLGVKSTVTYQGLFIVLTAPGIFLPLDPFDTYEDYVEEKLTVNNSAWRITSWHKNMRLMQVGNKPNEAGWGVYKQARRGGAIIATAHEHSYSRTHLLASCEDQIVASTDNTLVLARNDPSTPEDEGRSFVFVSGLGGRSIRDQQLSGDWWASIYTETQEANHGALFGVFHYQGDPCLAYFYFKDIDGFIADEFFVRSTLGSCTESPFIRGDANTDGNVNLADVIDILMDLFQQPDATLCHSAADANNDATVDVADPTYLLGYYFLIGSPAPEEPFPDCGTARTPLPCEFPFCP